MKILNWGANEWQAFANIILAIAAVIGGVWALFNYQKSRRTAAAHWLHSLYKDFYFEERFAAVRVQLEFHFTKHIEPLIERMNLAPEEEVDDKNVETLRNLDGFLNYFEYIAYLEKEKQLKRKDREALFQYWFDLIKSPEHSTLRRYLLQWGYENLVSIGKIQTDEYIAVYGTLMRGFGGQQENTVNKRWKYIGQCKIQGDLYDIGDYPGLIPGDGEVEGELYRLLDPSLLRELDEYEEFDPRNTEKSLFVRRYVVLKEPKKDCWVYFYNKTVSDQARIEAGYWPKSKQG